jgi:hypothetical protein
METINTALRRVQRGEIVTEGRLGMIPLLDSTAGEAHYLTLKEAMDRGECSVTEVSDSGSVPHLNVVNSGKTPVLILDGEQLLGAKQNRIVNLSIMLAPKSETTIPVTCVEQGRWDRQPRGFKPSEHVMYPKARADKMRHVSAQLLNDEAPVADQGAMWRELSVKAKRMDVHSDTGAMDKIFTQEKTRLDVFVNRCTPVEHQVGAVFALDGYECGVELFDALSTWRTFSPRLVRSWAVDAIEKREPVGKDHRTTVDLIERLCAGSWKVSPSLSVGWDARLAANDVTCGALLVKDSLVHLAAFGEVRS